MPRAELGRNRALVRGVAEREEQADRHGIDVAHVRQAREVERCELAVGPDSAPDAVRALERDERLGVPVAQAVEMGASLPAQMEQMLEALVADEGGTCPAALEQRVRRDGGPVRKPLDALRADRSGRR